MNIQSRIKNQLLMSGDGLFITDLKEALKAKGSDIMGGLKLLALDDEVGRGEDGRWYLTEKGKAWTGEFTVKASDLAVEFTAPLEAVAVLEAPPSAMVEPDPVHEPEPDPVIDSGKIESYRQKVDSFITALVDRKNRYAITKKPRKIVETNPVNDNYKRLRHWLIEKQLMGAGPFTIKEISKGDWYPGERRMRTADRAIKTLHQLGTPKDVALLVEMIVDLPDRFRIPASANAAVDRVVDEKCLYDPLKELERDFSELKIRFDELNHLPQAKVWAALCIGLDSFLSDLDTPYNMIRKNLQEMADYFSARSPIEQQQ